MPTLARHYYAHPGTVPGRMIAAVTLALALSVTTACGSSTTSTTGSGGSEASRAEAAPPADLGEIVDLTGRPAVTIEVVDDKFIPAAFRVSPGSVVTFKNTGVRLHDVTPIVDGAFTQISLRQGASGVVTAPTGPGTYRFFCTYHGSYTSGQRGALVVA